MSHLPKFIFLLITVANFVSTAHAQDNKNTLTLDIYESTYPPFFFQDQDQNTKGIIFDVIREIADELGTQIKVTKTPRKRLENFVESGKIDAVPLAKEWSINPDKFIFSQALIEAKDVIMVRKDYSLVVHSTKDLKGYVGTVFGYQYPSLNPLFNTNQIVRIDARGGTEDLLVLLINKRVDKVIINEYVAKWMIKNGKNKSFKFLNPIVDSVGFTVLFNKKHATYVEKFNQELGKLKESGFIAKTIKKYTI